VLALGAFAVAPRSTKLRFPKPLRYLEDIDLARTKEEHRSQFGTASAT
jgi:hypothetical protein